MKRNFTPYIYTFFFFAVSHGIFAQKLSLKITSKQKVEQAFLQRLKFKKEHNSKNDIHKELKAITSRLQLNGYFLNNIDSITKTDSLFTAYFSLGTKTKNIIIHTPNNLTLSNYNNKDNKITLRTDDIPLFLNTIVTQLESEGKSFSEVSLKNITLNKQTLYATLHIKQSKKRVIDRVIINGYDQFSKAHIKHLLRLKKGETFNQEKLKNSSTAIQALPFVSEIRSPEVLFTKDSTIIYMYLKQEEINSFDGLLNFTSKENGKGLLFNGHLDLKLNNILHTGEKLALLWKANGEQRQQFQITTQIPYIFNSAFTPEISFNIYKQDSTFLNTKFHGGLNYTISSKAAIGLTYDSENSTNTLQKKNNPTVDDFSNSFLGIQFSYNTNNQNNIFPNPKFSLQLNPSYGSRSTSVKNEKQFKINLTILQQWFLDHRNSIFIRNHSGYLNSNNFLENELYRIGGINSIRGFNEQSIFSSQFSYFNFEYRYLTSLQSYLYSITDIGIAKTLDNSNRHNLLGLGLGYLFYVKKSRINLEYAIGKTSNSGFDLNNSKIAIKIISFF